MEYARLGIRSASMGGSSRTAPKVRELGFDQFSINEEPSRLPGRLVTIRLMRLFCVVRDIEFDCSNWLARDLAEFFDHSSVVDFLMNDHVSSSSSAKMRALMLRPSISCQDYYG